MLIDALLFHVARLVIGIQAVLKEFHESRLSGTFRRHTLFSVLSCP
jgi:hypothetical protein